VADRRICPICARPIVVRVGIIEKHPKSGKPYIAREERRPRQVEWCDASSRRWDELVKRA
jgi:hypothetical protein